MKVAFFTQNSGNMICGSKQYPWIFAHTLAKLGHEVLIFTNVEPLFDREFTNFQNKSKIKIFVDLNYSVYDLEGRRNRTPKNRDTILAMRSCDLVVAAPYDSTDYGITVAKFFKKRCIVLLNETNDMINDAYSNGLDLNKIEDSKMISYQKQVSKADAIVVNSDYIKQSLRQWLPNYRGVIDVLSAPILSHYADSTKRYEEHERENSIVFCSRTLKYKGYGDIPYIFGQEFFLKEKPTIHYISGFIDGKFNVVHTAFFDLCKEANLNLQVHNRITEAEKFRLMSKTKLVYVPSRFETLGMTIAESLYVGTPVVCYDQLSIKSLYKDFPHYVSYNDPSEALRTLSELWNDHLLYRNIKEAQTYVTEKFSMDKFTNDLNNFLFKIVGTKTDVTKISPIKVKEIKKEEIKETRLKPIFKCDEKITVISVGETDVENLENQTHQNYSKHKIKFISSLNNITIDSPFVLLVNSGIKLKDRALEEIMVRFISEDCDLVCGNYEHKDQKRTKLTQYSVEQCIVKPDCIKDLIAIKTEVLDEFKDNLDTMWDFDLCLRAYNKNWFYTRKKLCDSSNAKSLNQKRYTSLIRDHLSECKLDDWDIKQHGACHTLEYRGDIIKPLVVVLTRNSDLMVHFLADYEKQTIESDLVVGIHIKTDDDKKENEIKDLLVRRNNVKYKFLKGDFNFSKMNNKLIDKFLKKDHTHIILINDDVFLRKDAIFNILSMFKYRWTDVGVVGAKMLFPEGDDDGISLSMKWDEEKHLVQHAGVSILKDINAIHRFYKMSGNKVSLNFIKPMYAVTFGFVAIDVDCYKSVRLDEKYPSDLNDMDFCLRAIKKGWKVVYNPFAVALHKESASRRESGHGSDPVGQKRFKSQYREFLATCITQAEHNEFLDNVI